MYGDAGNNLFAWSAARSLCKREVLTYGYNLAQMSTRRLCGRVRSFNLVSHTHANVFEILDLGNIAA